MNILKVNCALAIVAFLLPQTSYCQGTVTDVHGTTFLLDALPTPVKVQTGPYKKSRSGRISENPNYTGLDLPKSPSENNCLIHSLDGVVLVSSINEIRPGGWSGVEGVWHDFDEFPPEVGWALQKYLNQPVTLKSLDKMVKSVTMAYHDADRAVVDVVFPEQNISCGVVQLVVIESTLARIRIEGVDVDTEEYIRSHMRVRKGEVIRSSEVLHDVAWLNRKPHVNVEHTYQPGLEHGSSDLVLSPQTRDKNAVFCPPFYPSENLYANQDLAYRNTAYLGYEDSGRRDQGIGRDRIVGGFHSAEIWDHPGRALTYEFISDFDFNRYLGQSISYSHDLPWRHNLSLHASFLNIRPDNGLNGRNWALGSRYNIPLKDAEFEMCPPLFGTIHRTRKADLGLDYRNVNSNLEFGAPVNSPNPNVDFYELSIGYGEHWKHPQGHSDFEIRGIVSPGNISPHNSSNQFGLSEAQASSRYEVLQAKFSHTHNLGNGFTFAANTVGQYTNDNLLQGAEFIAGGYEKKRHGAGAFGGGEFGSVRGFDNAIISGERGISGGAELRSPNLIGRNKEPDTSIRTNDLKVLTFVDAAAVEEVDAASTTESIAAVGVGMRFEAETFRVRVDYGHPVLTNTDVPVDESGRFHIGVTATF